MNHIAACTKCSNRSPMTPLRMLTLPNMCRLLGWLAILTLAGCDPFVSPPDADRTAELGESSPRAAPPLDAKPSDGSAAQQNELVGRVIRVADGDTLTIADTAGRQYKIRFVGIDAPELKQPFGQQARQALSRLAMGKSARVLWSEKDQFDRTLGEIYIDDRHVNVDLVRSGWAWRYKYTRSEKLSTAESAARQERAGLWADASPTPPWEFRRQQQQRSPRR